MPGLSCRRHNQRTLPWIGATCRAVLVTRSMRLRERQSNAESTSATQLSLSPWVPWCTVPVLMIEYVRGKRLLYFGIGFPPAGAEWSGRRRGETTGTAGDGEREGGSGTVIQRGPQASLVCFDDGAAD